MAEQYTERPTEIEVFPLGSETDVILRKSIAESETTGENGDVATCWQCEERQIRVPGTVSAEDIAADFEAWWGVHARNQSAERGGRAHRDRGTDVGDLQRSHCGRRGRDADRRRNEAFFL